ncbi:MAG: hypothetical protein HQK51_17990 [Oligoflexia bacterium]|nr:hypothetical protein [Oligoflexia bacterium]
MKKINIFIVIILGIGIGFGFRFGIYFCINTSYGKDVGVLCEKNFKKPCYRGQVEYLPAKRLFSVIDKCSDAVPWIKNPLWSSDLFQIRNRYSDSFLQGKKKKFYIGDLEIIATKNEEIFLKHLIAVVSNDNSKNKKYIIPHNLIDKMKKAICSSPKTVTCILGALYGQKGDSLNAREESAMRVMLIAFDHGYFITPRSYYNPNGLAASEDAEWSLNSIKQINEVLEKLPNKFHHLSSLKYIYRTMESDQSLVSDKTLAWYIDSSRNEIIYKQATFNKLKRDIYGIHGVESGDKKDGRCTIAHELTHAFYQENENFVLNLPIWTKGLTNNQWGIKAIYDISSITTYSTRNYKEYFSEAVASFLCQGDNLKKIAPKLYEILKKNIFENREYLSENKVSLAVKRKKEDINNNIRSLRGELSSFLPIKDYAKKILNECLSDEINSKVKYKIINKTVYFYTKSEVKEVREVRKDEQTLIGRPTSHPYFRNCFINKAKKYSHQIIASYKDCNPPLEKDVFDSIFKESFNNFQKFEQILLQSSAASATNAVTDAAIARSFS